MDSRRVDASFFNEEKLPLLVVVPVPSNSIPSGSESSRVCSSVRTGVERPGRGRESVIDPKNQFCSTFSIARATNLVKKRGSVG